MNTIQHLEQKIEELSKEINYRNTNEEWQNAQGARDSNKYFWFHCGEGSEYEGRLQGLKEALKIIKGD